MTSTVKAYKGMGMEGSVARWYDRTTRKDIPEFNALAARIAATVPSAATVLEVAPGPGFLSIELARRGLQVCAVDISKTFVEIARRNAVAEGVEVKFELVMTAGLGTRVVITNNIAAAASGADRTRRTRRTV